MDIQVPGELLTKTRAGPCIYWRPLNEEDIREKIDKIQKLITVSSNLETEDKIRISGPCIERQWGEGSISLWRTRLQRVVE